MYKVAETAAEIKDLLDGIGLDVATNYRLSDAMREGSKFTKQSVGWGDGAETACALTAAFIAAKGRGFLE